MLNEKVLLLQDCLSGCRLQCGKFQPALFILANQEIDRAVAKVADAVKQHNRISRIHVLKLGKQALKDLLTLDHEQRTHTR